MSTTITYEGTLSGSRIEGELIERHEDGSVTVEHPAGDGWTYRVRAEDILSERTTQTFRNERDAVRFARAQGGPVDIEVEHQGHAYWTVTVSSREQEPASTAVQEEQDATPADTFESLLERMSNLASIPLDARESFDNMLREHFEGAINDDAGDEAEDTFEPGDRVLFTSSGHVGTVRTVDEEDVRVAWDKPVAPGILVTWTRAHRLAKVA